MAYQAEQDLDLIALTLHNLGEYKWTDATSALQEHIFVNRIMKKHKVGFGSGTSIDFNVQVNPQGSFQMVGMFASDRVNRIDTMIKGNVPFRHANANYAFDAHEVAFNKEPAKIVDLVKEQRAACHISVAEGMETQGFGMPSGTTDSLNAFGLPYWLVPSTTQGFNGGNPFGFPAGAGGISSTQYPTWANYTDQYGDFTKLDMIRKWRRAAAFTKFMSPVNADIPQYNTGDRYEYLTTQVVVARSEEAAEQQNDNLGSDIASKDGQAVFHRNPITWAPKLDALSGQGMAGTFSNTTYAASGGYPVNPILGVNWGVWQPFFLEGFYMREEGPYALKGIQHLVYVVQLDVSFNFICRDRRRCFVLTQ